MEASEHERRNPRCPNAERWRSAAASTRNYSAPAPAPAPAPATTTRGLYVIQNNWSIHRHPDVLEALKGWPQIEPVWLPTYAPWLNPIEKLRRWLRQDVLNLHRLTDDWQALRERVRAFLDQFKDGSQRL